MRALGLREGRSLRRRRHVYALRAREMKSTTTRAMMMPIKSMVWQEEVLGRGVLVGATVGASRARRERERAAVGREVGCEKGWMYGCARVRR